jgi:ABC-type branched-subunit amino acid transport system ATPase component
VPDDGQPADDLDRDRHATGADLADKVQVLHYGKELALGGVNRASSDAAVMATYIGKR